MRKFFSKFLVLVLAAIMTFGVVGCGGAPVEINEDSDGKRIEVKAIIAGYGTGWLTDIVNRFNEVYADEGYEVVVTQEDIAVPALNEIVTPKDCTTDIYFQYADLIDNALNKSRAILKSDKALLTDLSDVLNSPAINSSKQEEGAKISERLVGNIADSVKYKGRLKGFDGLYGIPWQGGTMGIYINKNVLAQYGYTQDDLLTTDDFLSVVSSMAPAPTDDNLKNESLMFPVAWSPQKAPGYWEYLFNPLMAQYEGLESFNNFYEFIPDEGDTVEYGYKVYEKQGIKEALTVLEKLVNKDWSAPGTTSKDHIQMQALVATGKAFMCVSGDWIYKELEADYSSHMENVVAIKTPVISALGVKLGLCGKTHAVGDTCADCNVKLREVVMAVDEGIDNDAQIVSKQGGALTAEKVKAIREARGYYQAGYYDCVGMIPSYSDAIKGSKLFLRFMYSDEAMALYRNKTYVDLPASYTVEPEEDSRAFVQAMYERMFNNDAKNFLGKGLSPIRTIANVRTFPNEGNLGVVANGLSYSHSHGTKAQYTVDGVYRDNVEYVRNSWTDYIKQAGLDRE